MTHRGRRSSHTRRQLIPPAAFFKLFLLCGSVLLLLTLLSFLAGPFLVSPDQHYSDSVAQGEINQHIHGNGTRTILGVTKSSTKNIWASKFSKHYYGCSEPSKSFLSQLSKSQSNGYLLVEASGGLNQQRTGIVDAVVVARILNATLVVPQLDHASFWKDSRWYICRDRCRFVLGGQLSSHRKDLGRAHSYSSWRVGLPLNTLLEQLRGGRSSFSIHGATVSFPFIGEFDLLDFLFTILLHWV